MSQISLTFPDGSSRAFKSGVTGRDVAEQISKSLAKKVVAVQLAQALGGAVSIETSPTLGGARFTVTFPDARS